jgi:hypothetical protein
VSAVPAGPHATIDGRGSPAFSTRRSNETRAVTSLSATAAREISTWQPDAPGEHATDHGLTDHAPGPEPDVLDAVARIARDLEQPPTVVGRVRPGPLGDALPQGRRGPGGLEHGGPVEGRKLAVGAIGDERLDGGDRTQRRTTVRGLNQRDGEHERPAVGADEESVGLDRALGVPVLRDRHNVRSHRDQPRVGDRLGSGLVVPQWGACHLDVLATCGG